VGTYEDLIPTADLVCNLTRQTAVVTAIMPLMKKGSTLSYSHGFNIVEEGMQIRKDITVIMCAPNVLDLKYVRSIKRFWYLL
jgi:ketol-acid reductoisomerase